jgi:hypothetical protein
MEGNLTIVLVVTCFSLYPLLYTLCGRQSEVTFEHAKSSEICSELNPVLAPG